MGCKKTAGFYYQTSLMERVKEQKGYPSQEKKGGNNIATLGGHKLEGAIKEARGFETTLFVDIELRKYTNQC